jgi:hypothetical protein
MAGRGGHKHRKIDLKQRRRQQRMKARANVERIRKGVEGKGQAWDPQNNPTQAALLNHVARRQLKLSGAAPKR